LLPALTPHLIYGDSWNLQDEKDDSYYISGSPWLCSIVTAIRLKLTNARTLSGSTPLSAPISLVRSSGVVELLRESLKKEYASMYYSFFKSFATEERQVVQKTNASRCLFCCLRPPSLHELHSFGRSETT
jgi:hypothetical protein